MNVRHLVRRQDMSAFALSLPLLVVSAFLVWETNDAVWRTPALVAIAAIHLSLLLRASRPWVTLAVTGIGALALLGSPAIPATVTGLPGPLPAVLLPSAWLFGLAIYSVAAHARSYRPLAIVFGVAGAAEVTASLWNGMPWFLTPTIPEAWRLSVAGVGVLLVALAYACGRWRALAVAQQDRGREPGWGEGTYESDTAYLDHAVAQQQARTAREVHRAVLGNLDEILSRAREGRLAARRAPAIATDALAEITQQGEEAFGRVQSLLSLLDDPVDGLDDMLADDAQTTVLVQEHALSPQPQLTDLPKLIDAARGEGLAVSLGVVGERGDLPVAGQLALYRTVQEALTNTVRHAGAGAVAQVELLWAGEEVAVTIEDEVPAREAEGFEESIFTPEDYVEGRGMRVVRERLEAVGGSLEVDQLENGYRVRGVVPREIQSPPG